VAAPTTINLICSHCGSNGGSDTASLVASGLLFFATALLALYAARALVQARKANTLSGYLEFFKEYRQYEPDRRYVLLHLRDHDKNLGVSGLPGHARSHVVNVCHYLDHLGFLVWRGMIDLDAVHDLMGHSILVTWRALAPYIKHEREERHRDYAQYYEHLAAEVYTRRSRVRRRFHRKLRTVPPNARLPEVINLGDERPLLSGVEAIRFWRQWIKERKP
jgi:hypothetical protein